MGDNVTEDVIFEHELDYPRVVRVACLQCRYLEFVERYLRYGTETRRDETMLEAESRGSATIDPPRLTLDRDGIGMGNVECVTRAQVWAGLAVLQAA